MPLRPWRRPIETEVLPDPVFRPPLRNAGVHEELLGQPAQGHAEIVHTSRHVAHDLSAGEAENVDAVHQQPPVPAPVTLSLSRSALVVIMAVTLNGKRPKRALEADLEEEVGPVLSDIDLRDEVGAPLGIKAALRAEVEPDVVVAITPKQHDPSAEHRLDRTLDHLRHQEEIAGDAVKLEVQPPGSIGTGLLPGLDATLAGQPFLGICLKHAFGLVSEPLIEPLCRGRAMKTRLTDEPLRLQHSRSHIARLPFEARNPRHRTPRKGRPINRPFGHAPWAPTNNKCRRKSMLQIAIARLREPSTYAGIAMLLGMAGVAIAPETWAAAVQVATGIASLAAIFLAEKK